MQETTSDHETWCTLQEAARRLGAHPGTVRRWADTGILPHIRTPGNHRRFALSDIEHLLHEQRQPAPQMADLLMEHALVQTRSSIVEHRDEQWLRTFSDIDRMHKRALGRRLMGLMLQFVSLDDGGEELLAETEIIGREYANNAISYDWPLSEALRMTQFFRDNIIDTVLDLPDTVHIKARDHKRLLNRINKLLNVVQLAVARQYEQQRAAT